MPFDESTIPEDQQEAFKEYVAGLVETENTAIAAKRDEFREEKKALDEKYGAATEELETFKKSFGEKTPEEIAELLKAQKEGDIKALIGENKLEEAAEAIAQNRIEEAERAQALKDQEKDKRIAELQNSNTTLDAQNREARLGKIGLAEFGKLDDHNPAAMLDVERSILADWSLDEKGDPIMYEADGKKVALDDKGNPMTLQYYVNETMRAKSSHYFKPKEGGGAPGGGTGASARDYGLGINQRSGVEPELRAAWFAKSRAEQPDLNSAERTAKWEEIPWEAKST